MSDKKVKKEKKPKSKARKIVEWVLTGIFVGLFLFFAAGQVDGMIHKKDNYGYTINFGYSYFIITTDSMEPEYMVNTAIITHKESPESIIKRFDNNEVVDMTFVGMYNHNDSEYDYDDYRPGNITYGGIEYKLEGNSPVYPNHLNEAITHRLIEYHIDESKKEGEGRYTFVCAGINTGGQLSKEGQYQLLTENELLGIVKVNSKALGGLFKFITSPWGLLAFLLVPAFYLVITSVLDIFKAIKEPDEEATTAEGETKEKPTGSASLEGLSDKDKERLKREMLEEMLNKKKGGNDGK